MTAGRREHHSVIPSADHKPDLHKYEVYEEIGHGGMATVYRGHDPRLRRDVAIKVIHRHLRENPEISARFASEARAVAKVRHPNIVEVYDVSDADDPERYLVVELVRGLTLRQLLAERAPLPPEIAAAIGLQVGAALGHAHDHGVIHRDVKPENVLVEMTPADGALRSQQRQTGQIKITDFGIAKLLDAQGVTSTGQVLGSPAHMAPEQIEGGPVTPRSDVFGLGVLLYECMVGKLPFDGKNPAQVLRRVLDGQFAPADRARPRVGVRYAAILARALAHVPDERYASVGELSEALEAELRRLGFDDPDNELQAYLADADAYVEDYEARLVSTLARTARAARKSSDVPLAAADFNRALAYRPDDAELLGAVAGLLRRQKMKRYALRGASLAAIVGAVVGAGAALLARAPEPPAPPASTSRRAAARPTATAAQPPVPRTRSAEPVIAPPESAPPESAAPESAAPERVAPARPATAPPAPRHPVRPTPPGTRPVKVVIRGARGSVKIDGQLYKDWFTRTYELPLGAHTFEFVPPIPDCCETPPPQQVVIEEGPEGDSSPQLVIGEIPLKPAVLQVRVPAGTEVTCPAFFSGKLVGPGERHVRLSRSEVQEVCTVLPPASEQAPPTTIDVTLTPGRTFTLRWP